MVGCPVIKIQSSCMLRCSANTGPEMLPSASMIVTMISHPLGRPMLHLQRHCTQISAAGDYSQDDVARSCFVTQRPPRSTRTSFAEDKGFSRQQRFIGEELLAQVSAGKVLEVC
eukprot:gb/GFBE01077244.1/.p1 GENE.gb/GFBE01077244.1/~~gb/GFBE01077244.1/.p1  ORF type:complete len:114 (+),score=10.22 gb/GFBE01077244.1/:1-342(+)